MPVDDVEGRLAQGLVVTVVSNSPGELLRQVRKWHHKDDTGPSLPVRNVMHVADVQRGLEVARRHPNRVVLIADSEDSEEISTALSDADQRSLEIIVKEGATYNKRANRPSASLMPHSRFVVVRSPKEALRKSLLRLMTSQYVEIRELNHTDKSEFEQFFALRYRVWKEMGFIPKRHHKTQWELDFTDRNSVPVGAFSKEGVLLGCIRLVGPFGAEFDQHVTLIKKMIDGADDRRLRAAFTPPTDWNRPFDVLDSFPDFGDYYARQTKNKRTPAAEVSRVIVVPEWRQRGLGEVLVDSAISLARRQGIKLLLLACQPKHAIFYRRCGFRIIRGMRCDSFMRVNVPAIAMDRPLFYYP